MQQQRTAATPLAPPGTSPARTLVEELVLAAERGGRDGRTAASIRFDSLDPDEYQEVLDGLVDNEPAIYDWLPRPTFRYGGHPVVDEQYEVAYEVGVRAELEHRLQLALGISLRVTA